MLNPGSATAEPGSAKPRIRARLRAFPGRAPLSGPYANTGFVAGANPKYLPGAHPAASKPVKTACNISGIGVGNGLFGLRGKRARVRGRGPRKLPKLEVRSPGIAAAEPGTAGAEPGSDLCV